MGMHNPAHLGEILKELVIDSLARIIHESFYFNRRHAAVTSLAADYPHPGWRARRSVGRHPVQGCLSSSRLHAPVSHGVSAVSSRTLMNNAG